MIDILTTAIRLGCMVSNDMQETKISGIRSKSHKMKFIVL